MQLSEIEQRLRLLSNQAISELEAANRKEDAIQIKNRYVGRKGEMQAIMKLLASLSNDEKKVVGQASNHAKSAIEKAYQQKLQELEELELERQIRSETIDVTLPARPISFKKGHPLRQVELELIDIFNDLGYEVAEGPEMETDFYNFEALNFPPDHPARDMQDTFMLEKEGLLRTHTSPVQVRTMLGYEPPIRIISPGRVYRCDSDITHSPVFHQIEGLVVDKNITFAHLKGTLQAFADKCFGPGTAVRLRPSFFPFTEPSAEVDIECLFCHSDGCRVCSHTGWLEILGAGMVDPNVFKSVGIDPDTYTGFAFGLGVERIAMLKFGINDIRLFFENDIRFLSQFS